MDKDLTQSHKKECSDWGTIWRGTVECVCEAGVWMLGSVPNKQVNTFTFSILQTLDSLQTCTWPKPAFTALHKHALESANKTRTWRGVSFQSNSASNLSQRNWKMKNWSRAKIHEYCTASHQGRGAFSLCFRTKSVPRRLSTSSGGTSLFGGESWR